MGIDFFRKMRPGYVRRLEAEVRKQGSSLFMQPLEITSRTFLAEPLAGCGFQADQQFIGQMSGDSVILFDGTRAVGHTKQLSRAIVDDLVARGQGICCCQVIRVHPRSGHADVRLQ